MGRPRAAALRGAISRSSSVGSDFGRGLARLGQVVFGTGRDRGPLGMTLAAPTIHSPGPLMQFPARIGRSNACVRVQKSRLEWSQVGRQWAIQMAPMTTITAVTLEPGPLKSSLIISMTVGTADFSVESGTAEQARTLLMQLIAAAAERSPVAASVPPAASCSGSADDMINLTWMNDARTVDPLDLEAEPARLLGF